MNTSQQRLARARAADILHELETVYRVPRALIDELRGLERRFVLYGGTAGGEMSGAATDAAFRQMLAGQDAIYRPIPGSVGITWVAAEETKDAEVTP